MDAAELEKYEYQLAQIEVALDKDPSNQEFITLKDELSSLIQLTREYLGISAPPPKPVAPAQPKPSTSTQHKTTTQTNTTATSTSTPTPSAQSPRVNHTFKVGDACLALYHADRKYYPAKVTSLGGSDTNRVYSVVFSGYDSAELVQSDEIKPVEHKRKAGELTEEEKEKERKRKKNEKKQDTKEIKTAEQANKQQSWQKFAKKSSKKGVVIPGITGASMFRSPDDGKPQAKVGVVGSGKGMTLQGERKRQTFE